MNADQENRRGRAGAVSAALAAHQTIINTVPAIVTQQGELNDSISLVDELSQGQQSATKGVTLNKQNIRDLMIKKTLQVAGQVKAWASVNNKPDIQAKVDITESTFLDRRDDLRDELAQEVHDIAQANLAALADYGTTAATLSALQTRIDAYTLAVPSTRTAKTQKKSLGDLLETELRRTDMIQRDRLDGLMLQIEDVDGKAFQDYQNARILVDATGGGAKKAAKKSATETPKQP